MQSGEGIRGTNLLLKVAPNFTIIVLKQESQRKVSSAQLETTAKSEVGAARNHNQSRH